MKTRRTTFGAAVAGIAAMAVAVSVTSSGAETSGSSAGITIKVGDRAGPNITTMGFDLQQPYAKDQTYSSEKSSSYPAKFVTNEANARKVFGNRAIDTVRIPIRTEKGWVRSDGLPRKDVYANMLKGLHSALRINPNLVVYASRLTAKDPDGGTDVKPYPDYSPYLKTNGVVSMDKYARFLADYLRFINKELAGHRTSGGRRVEIKVLGPDNEPQNNEANITADRFVRLVNQLKAGYGPTLPRLIMNNDATSGKVVTWLRNEALPSKAWGMLTYVGSSNQSWFFHDKRSDLHELAYLARFHKTHEGRKDLIPWDAEYHWDDTDGTGKRMPSDPDNPPSYGNAEAYRDSVMGLLGGLQQWDLGYSGMTWWGFKPCYGATEGTYTCAASSDAPNSLMGGVSKAELESALVDSTSNSMPLLASGQGTQDVLAPWRVNTRAFRVNDPDSDRTYVYTWLVNDSAEPVTGRRVALAGGTTSGKVLLNRWQSRTVDKVGFPVTSRSESWRLSPSRNGIRINLPAKSMTLVRFTLA